MTMKKIYMQPAIAEMAMDENKPIATSLHINNQAQNGIIGDVKAGGDWDWSDSKATTDWDVWGDASAE